MAKTYRAGEGGHLEAHNAWSQFVEDIGDPDTIGDKYPGLVGPEGPEGPQGPQGEKGDPGKDGLDGHDGQTPKALHISEVSNPAAGGETEVPFERAYNDAALEGYAFDPQQISVHLNGILLVYGDDYDISYKHLAQDLPHVFTVSFTEPLDPGDVVHMDILFAFAVAGRSASGDFVRDRGWADNTLPGDWLTTFPGIDSAMVLKKEALLEQDKEEYRHTLFVVLND